MIACFADPPYIGQAKKHYSHDPNCAEVDHRALIERMCAEYECWALSCSSPSLQEILSYCPPDVRIGAWVKPFASFKPNVNPAYAWEPVVLWGGRNRGRGVDTARDWVAANITLKKGLAGAKPPGFCYWLFDFMGLEPTDEFHDLFPGTGAVTHYWRNWRAEKLNEPVQVGIFEERENGYTEKQAQR